MARNSRHLDATPAAVWAVLEDPYAYPAWVVGTDATVNADHDWPAPGAAFRVHVGLGHVDATTSVQVEPGRKVVVDAASAQLGPARVTIELEPRDGGTTVTLIEDPRGKLAPLRWFPPLQMAIKLRNVESLRRLEKVVQARSSASS